jgi:parallel beta-helix repeat protein
MNTPKQLLRVGMLVLLALGLSRQGEAATLEVDNTGACDNSTGTPAYCTISAAIAAAAPGDTIEVDNGTYFENVDIDKDNLTLDGDSDPVIDCGGSGEGVHIAANGVTVRGLEVKNCAIGISTTTLSGDSTIADNFVHDNLFAGIGPDSSNCTITDNRAENNRWGFNLTEGSAGCHVVGNTAKHNRETGFLFDAGRDHTVTANKAKENGGHGFFFFDGSSGNTIGDNTAEKNAGDGFAFGLGTSGSSSNNIVIHNTAEKNAGDGFAAGNASSSIRFEKNWAEKNGGFGFNDDTSPPANTYTDNRCTKNTAGGSDPSGLCSPQP